MTTTSKPQIERETKKTKINEALEYLVKLGVLKETKGSFMDSKFSQQLDTMNPRASFMEGIKRGKLLGRNEVIEIIKKRKWVWNEERFGSVKKHKMFDLFVEDLIKQIQDKT